MERLTYGGSGRQDGCSPLAQWIDGAEVSHERDKTTQKEGEAEADLSIYQPPTRQLGPMLAAHPSDPKEKVPGCVLWPSLMGSESEEWALEISEKTGIMAQCLSQ